MSRARLALLPILACAMALAACGTRDYENVESLRGFAAGDQEAAFLFQQKCSGCHTLTAAGTEGSAVKVNDREYKDGPNFDQRAEEYGQVLYAIQNGGYSSGPMPQNIVTGCQAQELARFVAKYSGREAERPPNPTDTQAGGASVPTGSDEPDVGGPSAIEGCEE